MGVQWAWVTRWPSKLLCPPNNDDFWPLQSPPLSNSETSHRKHFAQGKSDFVVTVLGFADNVLRNAKPRAKGGSPGRLREARLCGLLLCLVCWPPDRCGSTSVLCLCPGISHSYSCPHSCRNVHQLSLLLLAEESAHHNMIPPLLCWAPPSAPGCRVVSMAPLSFSYFSLLQLPSSPQLVHFWMLE